jgi:hypothetical protein
MTTSDNTSGTLSWSTWTTAGGVDYFSVFKTGTSGTIDHSSYYAKVEVGDIVNIWVSARKWVAFRITSIETAPTDMYKWGISYISHDDADGTGNLDVDPVEHRWSRADTGADIGDISPAIGTESAAGSCTVGFRVDSDGDYYIEDTGSYVSDGTWIGNGTASQYECLLECTSGSNPSGPSLDTWLACSSDRTWTVTRSSAGFTQSQCKCYYRRTSDNQVLAVQPVVFNVTVT